MSAVFILDINTGFFLRWIFRPDFFVLDFSTLTPNYEIKYSNQNIVIKIYNSVGFIKHGIKYRNQIWEPKPKPGTLVWNLNL